MKILVVEDDTKIASFIHKGLKQANYHVDVIHDGLEAYEFILNSIKIDLIVLDLMLPGKSGLEVLSGIRAHGIKTPVLILSAKKSVDDKVFGLLHGADDYLEKPFAFSELLARVHVLLRRFSNESVQVTKLEAFGVELDLLKRVVSRENKELDLQAKEFALLEYLMKSKNEVITKTMILEKIYNYNFDTQTNIVDVLVCRLRNKIDKDFEVKLIHTIRGIGYVFKEN